MKVKIYNFQTKEELQEFDLASAIQFSGKCTVGRSLNSGLILQSSHVSRTHGVFIYQGSSYYFVDTGSANGSLINSNVTLKNQAYLLKAGDVLQIGEFVLTPQPVIKGYEDGTVPRSIDLQSHLRTFEDELSAVATWSEEIPVAVDAKLASAAEKNASIETLVTTKDVLEEKVAEASDPEKQKVSQDNTQSCVQLPQVNQQIKRVSPMTFSQKFYQSHELEIAEEFEQAIDANSLEKIKVLLDKILEL